MFSNRTDWKLQLNRLTTTLQEMHQKREEVLDFTQSNPTLCNFRYLSKELLAPLTDSVNLSYDPSPKGMLKAREAVREYYSKREIQIHPEQIFLTSSTSEAYSFLFRLLCDPEDHLLVPRPSYPLFDYLAGLNDVILDSYRLVYQHQKWKIDRESLEAKIQPNARGIILVHPNNPTGSFIKKGELAVVNRLAEKHQLALICDEVFSDYSFCEGGISETRVKSLAGNEKVLTFTLGGISKAIGLPQMKLAWIVVSGATHLRQTAIARLEVIADTYLSVNTPSQNALAKWLGLTPQIQKEIMDRVLANRRFLLEQCRDFQTVEYLEGEGGWYAVLRIRGMTKFALANFEEKWVLSLLRQERVLVHPGYFFDFEEEGMIVLSLITPHEVFQKGVTRLIAKQ